MNSEIHTAILGALSIPFSSAWSNLQVVIELLSEILIVIELVLIGF